MGAVLSWVSQPTIDCGCKVQEEGKTKETGSPKSV